MKILYLISSFGPGLGSSALHEHYVQALAGRGHRLVVASLAPALRGGPFLRELPADRYRLVHIACSRDPLARARNALSRALVGWPFFLAAVAAIRRLLSLERPDALHVETAFPLGAALHFGIRRNRRDVLTPQGEDVIVEPAHDYGWRRHAVPRRLSSAALGRAQVVRCISPLVEELVRALGTPSGRLVVVPCNIRRDAIPEDVEGFRREARVRVRSRLGAPLAEPLVLAFGRLHPFKGLDLFVDALAQLRKRGGGLRGAIVGAAKVTPRFGDYGQYLHRRAAARGVADSLRFFPEVPNQEAAWFLAAADAVVVPSTTESFNRVTIEAAAVGTPVVVTRSTGVSAFLDGEPWAAVLEERDPELLADAILRAIASPPEARRRGPEFATGFLPDAIARKMEPLYETAAAGDPR